MCVFERLLVQYDVLMIKKKKQKKIQVRMILIPSWLEELLENLLIDSLPTQGYNKRGKILKNKSLLEIFFQINFNVFKISYK